MTIEPGSRRLGDDVVETIVGDDGQAVNGGELVVPALGHALAERQAQAAPQGLLGQDVGGRRAQRNDGVEVGYVPAFLELVDVDDDLRAAVLFQRDQARGRFFALLAAQGGMDFRHLALETALEEVLGFDERRAGAWPPSCPPRRRE